MERGVIEMQILLLRWQRRTPDQAAYFGHGNDWIPQPPSVFISSEMYEDQLIEFIAEEIERGARPPGEYAYQIVEKVNNRYGAKFSSKRRIGYVGY